MAQNNSFKFIAGLALIGLVSQASAAQQLSLKALLDLNTSVASKVEQPIQDAPGIISVYSTRDLQQFGYWTIADLADMTAGYSSNIRFGEKGLETRGQGNDGWNNNKHLVLVDGLPVRNVRANKALIEENLPVFAAKRVEFLKGPASALYGVGAFFGVVNVLTEEAGEDGTKAQGHIYAGTEDNKYGSNASVVSKNTNGEAKVIASYYRKLASNTLLGGASTHPYQDNNTSAFLYGSYKLNTGWLEGLSFGLLHTTKEGGIGEYWGPVSFVANAVTWESNMPFVKYERAINDNISINSYVTMTQSSERGLWTGDPYNTYKAKVDSLGKPIALGSWGGSSIGEYNDEVRSYDAVAEVHYNLNETANFIAGANFYTNYGLSKYDGTYNYTVHYEPDYGAPLFSNDAAFDAQKAASKTYSGYLQYGDRFNFLKGTLLTLGLREDYGTYKDASFSQISPRAAVVQKLTDEVNLKLLYGTALRAPGQKEFGANEEVNRLIDKDNLKVGKPGNLDAETIQSFEGGLTYNNDMLSSSVSGFYNITSNILESYSPGKDSKGTDLNAYRNSSGKIKAYGVEADAQALFGEHFRVLGNYGWAAASDTSGKPFASIPTQKINAGLAYNDKFGVPVSLALVNKYVLGYTTGTENKELDARNSLDAYLTVGLSENLNLTVQARNLLDDDYKLPAGASGTNDVPVDPRQYIVGIKAQF